jgi:hypothetical protein
MAEWLNEKAYLEIGMCVYQYSDKEIDQVIAVFRKVWSALDELQ